ncbi:MAG: dihydroorotate dehydrogenase electron transfer subunit, partial [Proteobacteria bacterium]|nr:dihydroorotate dehydrogenase electron transfer subunit [Pseudomonadota bacterium]
TSGIMPFLRRPFSVHNVTGKNNNGQCIDILYEVVGEFTGRLSEIRAGEWVDIMGPLGKGFALTENCSKIFIVAGGIGVAPMFFLSSYIIEKKHVDSLDIKVFLGARTKECILCRDDFYNLGLEIIVTTDDGSEGEPCFITSSVEAALAQSRPEIIFACGPLGMLKSVARIALKYGVPCQVSMESLMACGIGACLGCALEGNDESKYLHVCKDGPVFDACDIKFV